MFGVERRKMGETPQDGLIVDATAKHQSYALEAVSKPLAAWTVTRHAAADPSLTERCGGRPALVARVEAWIAYLVQALALRSDELFVHAVDWARSAAAARKEAVDEINESLAHLSAVIGDELPPTISTPARRAVQKALDERSPMSADTPQTQVRGLLDTRALEYLDATLAGRGEQAVRDVLKLAAAGTSLPEIYEQILQPAQAEIGEQWHRGEITIADEHYTTATTQRLLSALRVHSPTTPLNQKSVITTAIDGDIHEVGLRMAADYFEWAGWTVHYLGCNLPVVDLLEFARVHDPSVFAISVGTFLHLRSLGELIEVVREDSACGEIPILVGGPALRIARDLWRELGADGFAESAADAVKFAERLTES